MTPQPQPQAWRDCWSNKNKKLQVNKVHTGPPVSSNMNVHGLQGVGEP